MTPDADALTPLYILVGTGVVAQLAGAIVGAVKWLGARTVEREDKDKQDIKATLKEHEGRFEELEQSLRGMDRSLLIVQNDVRQVSGAVESIRGSVAELRTALSETSNAINEAKVLLKTRSKR